MQLLTPTTELEAVNLLLEAIEEERIPTLVDVTDPDVVDALATLDRVSRDLQLQGWEFNTEGDYPLSPDHGGLIAAPGNLVSFKVPGEKYAIRAGRIFNRKTRTYTFSGTINGEAVFLLSFEELPTHARHYVSLAAAFSFQARRGPDELTSRLTKEEVGAAWASFLDEDTREGGFSFSHISSIQNRAR